MTTLGSVNPPTDTTTDALAKTRLFSNVPGKAIVSATVDNETVTTGPITVVTQPPPPPPLVRHCTITRTPGNDILRGTSGADVICSRGGNDIVYGRGGNDTIYGDGNNDVLRGEGGNDRVYGGRGNDAVRGGAGNERLCRRLARKRGGECRRLPT